jgi:hypothetical protein
MAEAISFYTTIYWMAEIASIRSTRRTESAGGVVWGFGNENIHVVFLLNGVILIKRIIPPDQFQIILILYFIASLYLITVSRFRTIRPSLSYLANRYDPKMDTSFNVYVGSPKAIVNPYILNINPLLILYTRINIPFCKRLLDFFSFLLCEFDCYTFSAGGKTEKISGGTVTGKNTTPASTEAQKRFLVYSLVILINFKTFHALKILHLSPSLLAGIQNH